MEDTFACPKCGGPLDHHLPDPILRCPYCTSAVIVPENLRAKPSFSKSGGKFTMQGASNMAGLLQKAAQLKQVKDLALAGKEEEAVRLFQQATGQDETSARQAVQMLAAGQPITISASEAGMDGEAGDASLHLDTTVSVNPGARNALRWVFGIIIAISLFGSLVAVAIPLITGGIITAALASAGLLGQPTPAAGVVSVVPPIGQPKPTPTPAYAQHDLLFGEEGNGPAMFDDARHVASIASNGNFAIADYSNGRVQLFNSNGEYQTEWRVQNRAGDGPALIRSIAASREGDIYLAAEGRLLQYDQTGTLLGTTELEDYLLFVQVAPNGDLFVTGDTEVFLLQNGLVVGGLLGDAYEQNTDLHSINDPFALGGDGNLYMLASTPQCAVFVFSQQGQFLNRFGSCGDEPGQLHAPYSIAVDGKNRVFIGDINGIQVFGTDGRWQALLDGPPSGVPFGLAIDGNGRLLAIYSSDQFARFVLP